MLNNQRTGRAAEKLHLLQVGRKFTITIKRRMVMTVMSFMRLGHISQDIPTLDQHTHNSVPPQIL